MGEICFWLTADIRLSERNKGRADAHVRIYISQRCRFQMHVSPFVFPAAAKESRWHAARPRGRNPSPRERKRRTHTFQRTRSIVFITVTLISPALILQTVTRGLRVVLVLTSLPPAEIAVMRYTRRNGPVPPTAERHRASPQVKRWGDERRAEIVNKAVPLVLAELWFSSGSAHLLARGRCLRN